ncbi:hypothetical protein AAMO2058_000885500 [Amorphochlora amoebiformis]
MSQGPDNMKAGSEKADFKQQLIDAAMQFIDVVDEKCKTLPVLPDLAKKLGPQVKPAYIALGTAGFVFFIFLMMIGFNAITNIICFAYPAVAAIKAMQAKEPGYDEQWLTYFMIFGMFHVIESFYPELLTEYAFYVLVKLLLLVWCFLPMSMGAKKIYNIAVKKIVTVVSKSESKTE